MKAFFYILGTIALVLWGIGYLWISGLACAFGSLNGDCRTKPPWELQGEDLMLMVMIPGLITVILFGLGWLAGVSKPKVSKDD